LVKDLRKSAAALLVASAVFSAQAQSPSSQGDFANKSIEELMNIDVTSVARKDQKLWKTPAAVYAITQEEIQRSGATTIPDLLRMAPGVQVAQVEPDRWAISVRGFNGLYSNKLLVLVDGRTVYTPSFSGVYWDQIDIPLDTIERIEVIRGPGGTVWGANAVNGVINIITMSARDTQGAKVTAGAGSEQTAGYLAQFGGKIGDSGAYRISGGYSAFGALPTHDGSHLNNGWDVEHGGFRLDQKLSATDSLTLEGNAFSTNGNLDERAFPGVPPVMTELANHGFDVMGRWTRTHSERSQSSLQVYETNYSRSDTGMSENLHTLDLDFQNQFQAGSRNNIVWAAATASPATISSHRPRAG
jgi:iron complex outermembrane receptor protein